MKFPLLVLLAAGALSAPFNNYQDFVGVTESKCDNPRRLAQHATTLFEYEGQTLSTIQGSTSESTGLMWRARVYIHPQGACRFSMQINNAELLVSKKSGKFALAPESAKFARELEANNLAFETSNGKIERLFPSNAESTHTLNIKRGVLSTLQLGEKNTEEVDVNGRCKVSLTNENGMMIKTKNLSECSERSHNELGFQTATLENKEMPIKPLNSTSRCVIRTENEKIIDVQCEETHIFRPFSAGFEKPSGAMTFVKQSMRSRGEKRGRILVDFETESKSEGVSLVFSHESEEMKPVNSIVERIDKVMAKLVDVSRKDNFAAKQESAHEFTELVTLLRKVDKKRMTPVMEKYFNCDKSGMCKPDSDLKGVYRQYFLDALTYCGTPTCVSAVHSIIVEDGITGENMNMFLQGIALVAKPTKGMIRDVKDIASRKPSRQAFLTLGTLMHRYCSANEGQCAYSKSNPVTHAELFLEDKLGNACNGQENLDRVEEILMSLKAIGNAGRPSRAWKTLLSCAKSAAHQNITTAALEALRRMPCNAEMQMRLHEMLENMNMDPEKRIQTYIALMRCPTEESMKRITTHLEKEGSRQVGSFIWSHLKNVNESSDPRHARTQEILATVLKGKDLKEFNLPMTRFSKAFEGSIYSKFMKSGGSVDGHLIYHPDSILPKSALLNVTANILEVPVNVFEMAARVEGIETLLEDLFGADGYFPDNSIVKIFNYTFSSEDRARLRQRRSYGSDSINENIKNLHEQVNKKRVRPSGSLSMKILGHEMRVFSYDDIFWAVDQIDNMNVIDLLLKVAKGGHKTFTKSVMFLEMTHSVPTGLGFPLKLNLKGSAVGSLELDGKFDIRNMFWGPSSMEIKGYVRPSAVVEVSGQMGVSTHFVDTGIFVNSSMFTSSMIKGSVAYKEGKLFKVNIDAPEEPIEIFNISSTPFLFTNEDIKLIQGAPRRLSPDFCLNSTTVFGLGICTSMSVPVAFREYESPYFPLSGPAHYGMKLIKTDPKLTTYQFMMSFFKKAMYNGYEMIGSFQFGTPGATYSRGMTGVVKYQETNTARRLIIGEFQNKNSAELMIQYQNETHSFEVDFRSNLFTSKPINTRFLLFNETRDGVKRMGVLASAAYDWYKFEHVTDFTRSENLYSLRSKTTYWPGKFVLAQIGYLPKEKEITMKFEANQFKQAIRMNGRYIVTTDEKGLNFTVQHLPSQRKSSFYAGIINTKEMKSFVMNTTCPWGRRHQLSWSYYNTAMTRGLRFTAQIMNRTASMFAHYTNAKDKWYGVDVGAKYEGNVVGIIGNLNGGSGFDRETCLTAYYNDKRPAETCISLKKASPEVTRLMWSAKVLKRAGHVSFDYQSVGATKGVRTTLSYNNKELIKNTMTFTYKSLWETELKSHTEVGKRSVVARVFSEIKNKNVVFGAEAKAFNKMVKLQATYSTVRDEDATNYVMTVEGWVNQKLPVSYVAALKYGKQEMMVRSAFNFKDYQVTSAMSWKRAASGKRTATRYFGIVKKDLVIFSSDVSDMISLGGDMKFYRNEWRFTIMNKNFKYGWDLIFQDKSTVGKAVYAVTFGVDYARNRRSAITGTFSNSQKATKFVIDFMYIPQRQVSHVFSYDKQTRQLDISIEFLPRMFVKLMGRLDKAHGFRFTTDLKFTWSNYERVLTWVAAYVNRTEMQALSFKFMAFNEEFLVATEYNPATRTFVSTVSALGRHIKLTGFWMKERKQMGLKLTTESMHGNVFVHNQVMEAIASYNEKYVIFELRRKNAHYFKTIAFLGKSAGQASFELFVLDKSMVKSIVVLKNGVASFEFLVRDRSMFKVQGELKKSQDLVAARLFVLGKERFQAAAKYNKEKKTAVLVLDALKKNLNIIFAAKWDPIRKEVTISTEAMKRIFGVAARFDVSKYAASWYFFYQKHFVGVSTFYDARNKALAYNVTLTPRLSAQVVMQILQDRIIAVTLQRKFGLKIVNEASFKYELGSDASKIIFHWNKETTNQIRDVFKNIIVPTVKKALMNVTEIVTKIGTSGKKFSIEAVKNVTSQVLRVINEADKRFDNIDFIAIKDKTGEAAVVALKKTAELINKALKMSSKLLFKIHEKLPEMMENARMYAKKSVELSQTALKEAKVVMKKAEKIAQIAYGIVKNITESGIPVAKTAFKLAKEFKIRGKTMEQIVKDVAEMSEKFAKAWKENLAEQVTKIKKDAIVYIRNMPVPYRKEKLGELFTLYMNKLQEFRANFNIEEKARELTRKIMEYKIKGMTIAEHVKDFEKRAREVETKVKQILKDLPEDVKKIAIKMIAETRTCIKKAKKIAKTVTSFLQPIVRCLRKVKTSINKHFGPLVTKAITEAKTMARTEFTKVYRPTRETIMRIVEIIERFMAPFVKPIRPLIAKIRDQVKAIRVFEKEIGPVFDAYLDMLKMNIEAKLMKIKSLVSAKVEMLIKEAKAIGSMAPEQIVESTVDKSIELSKDAIKYARSLYKRRQMIIKEWKLEAENLYKMANKMYAVATSKPVEEVMHMAFKMSGDAVMTTLKELAKTIDQIANMDFSKPLEAAWREMDLINHLEKYGINSNIAKAIQLAKNVNLTESLFRSIEATRMAIMKIYSNAEARYQKVYKMAEGVYKYIRSIPKKDWEDFYTEVEEFVLRNKGNAYEMAKKIASFTKRRLIQTRDLLKQKYEKYVEEYGKPVVRVYKLIKDRAMLVYDENKDDCALVMRVYKDMAAAVIKAKYAQAKAYAEAKYKMARAYAEARYEMVRAYAQAKYEEYYKKAVAFYRKYEDKTWEMIGQEIYEAGNKYYKIGYAKAEIKIQKARVMADKAVMIAKEFYANMTRIAKKYAAVVKTRYENEVKPEVMRMYAKAVKMYKEAMIKAKETLNKAKQTSKVYYQRSVEYYQKIRGQCLDIYESNKALSIRQLYKKIVALISKMIIEQTKLAKAVALKKYEEIRAKVNTKVIELKQKVMELQQKAKNIHAEVTPIVLFEAESIFNQTLRATVIIANETVKAYTPHFNIVKAYTVEYYGKGKKLAMKYYADAAAKAVKYYGEMKMKSLDMYKKGMMKFDEQVKKIVEYIKELVQKIKNHPKYQEILEHKYTKQTIKMLKELKAKMEPKIAELKMKIAEFRAKIEPKMAELRAKMEPKIAELRAKIEELKSHPKVVEIKQKIAEYRQKLEALKEHRYVLQAIEILKQVRESGMFTVMKLKGKLMPHAKNIKAEAMKIPDLVIIHARLFRRDPAECVWTIVANIKAVLSDIRIYDWKSIDAAQIAKDLIIEITDDRTKEMAMKLKTKGIECYKACKAAVDAAPKYIKEEAKIMKAKAIEIYNQQLAVLKVKYNDFKAAWKRCPLNPIVNHEIWGELIAEVKNHELVAFAKSIAIQTKYTLDIYRAQFVDRVRKYADEKKAEIKQKYEMIVAKVNTFLDETTLEDIVNKAVESYETAKAKIMEKREKVMMELKKAYEKAKVQYVIYKQKAEVIYKKYYAKADKIWKEKYPVIKRNATILYQKAKQRVDRIIKDVIRYSKEMKVKVITKSLKMWNESQLKKSLFILKGMTVGETVAEIRKLPQRTREMYMKLYGKALKIAEAKVAEMKAKYDRYLRPHVMRVERIVRAVVDEVNATAIFVYRYYDLKGNMYKVRDLVRSNLIKAREFAVENAKKYKELVIIKVKTIVPKIPSTLKMYAKKLAKASLKSIHASMVCVDNFDVKPYLKKITMLKKYIPDVNKYIIVDTAESQLVFRIPHYKPVEPSFSYQIKKVDTTVRNAAAKIKKETVELTKKMIEYARNKIELARNKTAEIREDFNTSMMAHSELGRYFYKRAVDVSSKAWDRSLAVRASLNETLRKTLKDASKYAQVYSKIALKKGKEVSIAVFTFANDAIVDITYSNGFGEAYAKAEKYATTAVETIKSELTPVYEMTNSYAKDVYRKLALQYFKIVYKTKPYYLLVKTAVKEWRNGAEFRTAFRVIEVQLRKAYIMASKALVEKLEEMKTTVVNSIVQEDLRMLKEYLKSHKTIAGKYAKRLYRVYKIGKVRLDRAIRKAKLMMRRQWKKQPLTPFRSTAMIFGTGHVMTFDGKFYDIPHFPKKSCTYLLARDFKKGNFTILSQKEHLIIQTPDMEVFIHQNGQVTSTVKVSKYGYEQKKEVRDLPVQSDTGFCKAKREGVVCEFKQGLRVSCDNKHFLCSIHLSSWHYGKTQGLLGTNNNEIFDEFKMPDNTITDSVTEFVNSWLVTRDGSCKIKQENNEAPSCNKAPSERCFSLFRGDKSPFARHFKTVDPLPFLKACLVDTADCESKESMTTSHCNVTAAYRRALKMNGDCARDLEECMVYKTKNGKIVKQGEKWTQPITKDVDVVVMVSERAKARSLRRTIALMIFNLNKRLVKRGFATRYSLVGFGGDEVHEEPHVQTINGRVFSTAGQLSSIIKEMPYTGEERNTNDAYAAISLASKLNFRPGARKVFVVFNFDEGKPWFFGPTLDETVADLKMRANATLIVFDNFKFRPYGKSRVIGQTESRVYLSPDYQAVPMNDFEMPHSKFTKLVRVSDGGMFINKLKRSQSKIMVTAVIDALMQPLTAQSSDVQCCRLNHYYPVCKTSNRMNC